MDKIWNRNFTLLACSNFLTCINYYLMVSVLPIYLSHSFGADKSEVGFIMSAFMVASVCMRPFAGFALDKYGRRSIFLTALLINVALFVCYLFASHLGALLGLRIVQGLAWGVITISGSILAADNIPITKRGEGFGYYGLSTTFAMAVGPVSGLFLMSHLGYTGIFVATVAVSLVSFLFSSFIHYPPFEQNSNIQLRFDTMFDKNSLKPAFNLMVIMSAYGGLLSFVALYGKEIGVQNTSWFFLVFAIGIASARFGIGQVFDTRGPKQILTLCLLLLIAGFVFLALVKNSVAYYSSGIVLGFGIGAVFPGFQAMINNMATAEKRGAANSTLYTALDLGMGLGMIVTGYLGEYFSISLAFLLCAVIILFGLLYFRNQTLALYARQKIV